MKLTRKRSARRNFGALALSLAWLTQSLLPAQPLLAAEPAKSPAVTAQLPAPLAAPLPMPKAAAATQWVTIRDAIKNDLIGLKVVGDGVHTSHVRLSMTNKTAKPLVVFIPANEVLHPGSHGMQKMLVLRSNAFKLTPGAATEFELSTVCADVKSIPPPPGQASDYTAGPYGDDKLWHQIAAIIAAADQIDREGGYKSVPMKNERKQQIAQFAIWRLLGQHSKNPEDSVTPESIESDLLRASGDIVKKDPARLAELGEGYELNNKGELVVSGKRKKALEDNVVSPIFEAIDLTMRKADDPRLKNVAPLPPNGAWDTFIAAGERAYNNG
jgi:hypothetical protein